MYFRTREESVASSTPPFLAGSQNNNSFQTHRRVSIWQHNHTTIMPKSYGRTINILPGSDLTELKNQLREVWPEVLTAFKDIGILKAKTFLTGNTMFTYFETEDSFDPSSFDSWIMTDERCVEWSQWMQKYETPCDSADQGEGEWWKTMEEIFCFETQHETQLCDKAHETATSYSNSYMY